MEKIDIHVHFNTREREEISDSWKKEKACEFAEYLKQNNVEKAILMSMGETGPFTNEDCAFVCAQQERLLWNCNFDDTSPETIFDRMREARQRGAVGVGELMINRRMDAPVLKAIFSAAEKLEMPVLIHMSPEEGYEYGVVDDPGLPLLEKTLQEYPSMTLIGHSQVFWIEISKDAPADKEGRYGRGRGKVEPGGRLVELFENYANLYGDLSAGSGYAAITRDEKFGIEFLERFSDRLLYGTDTVYPGSPWVTPIGSWMEKRCREGKISRETLEKICYRNAQKLYHISIPD